MSHQGPRIEATDFFQWKPEIPHSFYKINPVHSTFMAMTSLFLYFAPLAATYYLLHLPMGWLIKSIIMVFMGLVMAIGNVLLAIFTHEAAHYTLYSNRILNQIAGIICLSVTPSAFLSCTRFFELHVQHHKYFHTQNDPEEIFSPYANQKLTRYTLLLGMRNTIRYLLNYSRESLKYLFLYFTHQKIIEDELKIKHKNKLFIFECVFYLICLSIQIYFIFLLPALLFLYLISNLFALIIIVAVGHASHAFTFDTPVPQKKISNWIPGLLLKVSFGTFLHLEHHAYPAVPAYQLPRLSHFLYSQGFYTRNNILLSPIHLYMVSKQYK